MEYPTLQVPAATRRTVEAFLGLRHGLQLREGEFSRMENLTSDHYPLLSPRGRRGRLPTAADCRGLIAKDTLCRVEGSQFVMGEYRYDMDLTDGPKDLVSMGAYVIILPDKQYINTARPEDRGPIEASFTTQAPVTLRLCNEEGTPYAIHYTQAEAPGEPENLQYWLDISAQPPVLKQYAAGTELWVPIAATYLRLESPGIGRAFRQYDGVLFSGLPLDLDGAAVLWQRGDDFVVISGLLDSTRTVTDPVTLSRQMPDMDFVVEAGNRLFGCRYGLSADGRAVNEIYASKLGDFTNWNCFMGLSTDSYAASLGSDGRFTGAVTHLGYPLFFKEECLHKVYGRQPSEFRIQETACRGVERGSSRSLALVGETLYYKSREGICAYDGSLPRKVSEALGDARFHRAVGGSHGGKYYLSALDEEGARHLLVYDTGKGLWHREEGLAAAAFCSCGQELYVLQEDGTVLTLMGSGEPAEEAVRWYGETGVLDARTPDRAYLSRLSLRLSMEPGSRVTVEISYDGSGIWEQAAQVTAAGLGTFTMPIRPRRCDHLQLRISGEGPVKICSLTRVTEKGSDLP